MRKFKQQFLAGPYLIWIIGFILLPLIMILYYAFTNGDGSFTLSYITAIADETNRKAMGLSLRLGIICTIVCLVLSYPLAMILNNRKTIEIDDKALDFGTYLEYDDKGKTLKEFLELSRRN
jgi:spermidine/putrescine transport system permease protein